MKAQLIFPRQRIGIIGGGQLGRMMAFAAKRMGYFVTVLDPDPNSPCAQVVDQKITAEYNDIKALRSLAKSCKVITYEFENIDLKAMKALEGEKYLVRPSSYFLELKQSRIFEKNNLTKIGIPVPAYQKIETQKDIKRASKSIGYPSVLKTVFGGYDGKGQAVVTTLQEANQVFKKFDQQVLIWEKKVRFVKELSIVAARSPKGAFAVYPVSETYHALNILNKTITPANVAQHVQNKAIDIARSVADHFNYIGVFCVEFFLLEDGRLLVNEIAPRPHNSGHYTIESADISQFEQHIRAICGLPLGSTMLRSPTVMMNILGDGRGRHLEGIDKLLEIQGLYLHLYGKEQSGPRRKIGHFTVLRDSVDEAVAVALSAKEKLRWVE